MYALRFKFWFTFLLWVQWSDLINIFAEKLTKMYERLTQQHIMHINDHNFDHFLLKSGQKCDPSSDH
jgi:hypothetical protein